MNESAKVVSETLTDGSEVFNVQMTLDDGARVQFDCYDEGHAETLATHLNACTNSEVRR